MIVFLTIVHVLVCLALISIVLLQHGKGADIGAAFGGSSQTIFGASGGATFLGKLTAGAAIVFMITTLGLSIAHKSDKSVVGGSSVVDKYAAPAAPAQTAPAPAPVEPVAPVAPKQ